MTEISRERRIAEYKSWLEKGIKRETDIRMHVSQESWGEAVEWCLNEIERLDEEVQAFSWLVKKYKRKPKKTVQDR